LFCVCGIHSKTDRKGVAGKRWGGKSIEIVCEKKNEEESDN
jgi:hypothetical protein